MCVCLYSDATPRPAPLTGSDAHVCVCVCVCVRQSIERFGRVDVWVNNAGRGISKSIFDVTDEDFDEMYVRTYVHVCVYVCMYACMHVCCSYVSIQTRLCLSAFVHHCSYPLCLCACVRACVRACVCVGHSRMLVNTKSVLYAMQVRQPPRIPTHPPTHPPTQNFNFNFNFNFNSTHRRWSPILSSRAKAI
jgi:hypothetical protein